MILSITSGSNVIASADQWYTKITNPVSWLSTVALEDNFNVTMIDPYFVKDNEKEFNKIAREYSRTKDQEARDKAIKKVLKHANAEVIYVYTSSLFSSGILKSSLFGEPENYANRHDSFLLNLLTFGNDDSQRHLKIAYRMGCYIPQYHSFIYTPDFLSWTYIGFSLDALSLLLYGFSWAINIPQRFVSKVTASLTVWERTPGEITVANDLMLIDAVTSGIASCTVDLMFCFTNPLIGTVVAAVCHPLDSLCSLPGMIYFDICAIWTAIVDIILSVLVMIWSWF